MRNPLKYDHILIVRLSAIGDVVMTTPVAKALRNQFPDARISWVVESKCKDVVIGNPYIDNVIVWEKYPKSSSGKIKLLKLLDGAMEVRRRLKAEHFDLAIDFQGLFKSGLATLLSGAKYRLGFADARECTWLAYNMRVASRQRISHGPADYMNLLERIGISSDDIEMHMPISDSDREYARSLIMESPISRYEWRGMAVLCPATTWQQKHWTEDGWATLADALVERYAILPVFMGSRADVPLIQRITGGMKNKSIELAGRTTLNQAAAVLDMSSLVVAVDTALLHIGVALGRPTVGIFGPTTWDHLACKGNFIPVSKHMECAPCLRRPTCSDRDCMRALSAEEILATIESRVPSVFKTKPDGRED